MARKYYKKSIKKYRYLKTKDPNGGYSYNRINRRKFAKTISRFKQRFNKQIFTKKVKGVINSMVDYKYLIKVITEANVLTPNTTLLEVNPILIPNAKDNRADISTEDGGWFYQKFTTNPAINENEKDLYGAYNL